MSSPRDLLSLSAITAFIWLVITLAPTLAHGG